MMKKLLFCLVTLLGTGAFYSCQQDEVVNEVLANKSVTIRASLPGDADSRVILGETTDATTDIYWEENDVISLTIGSKTFTFTITDFVANQTTATFTCADANLPETLEAGNYTFVYGSEAIAKEQAGTKEDLSDYHYMTANFENTEATPWNEVNLTFETQVAIVEIPIPADASVTWVTLYNIADGAKIATTEFGATIGEKVYFAVPAGSYDGFVLAEDEEATGDDVYTAYLSSNELQAGNLYRTKDLTKSESTPINDRVSFVELQEGSSTYVFWGNWIVDETFLGDIIEKAIILEDIKVVGLRAFQNCTNLESFILPSTVDKIYDRAFEGCTSLTSITLPETVTQLGGSTFLNCENLASIIIPSGVTIIGNGTFEGCKALTSITLPSGVTEIGSSAFVDCEKLASVNIPSGVTQLGSSVFRGCKALTSITLPESVTSIGDHAFLGCEELASVNIPSGVTSIGVHTFQDCKSLTSINLHSGVTSIGEYAFSGCDKLTSVNIPAGVTIIPEGAFALMYLEAQNNQKQPEITKHKPLIINIF